ncbi:TIGR00269 family protein [Ignisphaera sp. 4213-co]|uniref:TIGR00269 family protein n=1 Tax=Ignisphaera cupida TaxID=3050454 RepID=A0ABD4ZBA7_9CREN|nr:TIGR00269 family protein [Ignisphaera sp. 4213-co]MDK6029378.1 TIGR00269 family protein [Ignisphaera sp. 4213-co]
MVETKIKCSFCNENAVTRIGYAKLWLCKEHFIQFIEKKVFNTFKRYGLGGKNWRILAAVSGGKDSVSMLYILHKLSKDIGFELIALHIDLGIGEYSKISREVVENLCKSLGIPLIVLDLKELTGFNLPEMVSKTKRPPCSLCGLIKRYLINVAAQELKANAVALGHHLDDLIPYIIKNFVLQNLFEISKLGPKTDTLNGLVGRIRPLYEVSEDEIMLYAYLAKLPFVQNECPYSARKGLEKTIREFINNAEKRHPGFKIAFARSIAKNIEIYKNIGKEEPLKQCKICQSPSNSEICSFCKITAKVAGKPLGSEVKTKIAQLHLLNLNHTSTT